jgi:hypothetical protein
MIKPKLLDTWSDITGKWVFFCRTPRILHEKSSKNGSKFAKKQNEKKLFFETKAGSSLYSERGVPLPVLTSGGE